jgi:ABC-type Fe3+-siderophore transport system permease subunit
MMRVFVVAVFSYEMSCAVIGLLLLTFSDFPYTRTVSRAEAAGHYVMSVAIALVCAYLLWGQK